MAQRRMGIMALLLCFCLCFASICAGAASTEDAKEPIAPQQTCTLTLCYGYDGTAFADVSVRLYRIAEVSADFQYTLTTPFAPSGLILNGVRTNGEWNVIRSTLETLILADGIEPNAAATTDEAGLAHFDGLPTGLYLALVDPIHGDSQDYLFDSALIALPGLGQDGLWQYEVAVTAKGAPLPPIEPDEELQLKVLKLWKGDEGQSTRPESIQVEIFQDNTLYETVTLSADTGWAYTWTVKNDGASWHVVERNVPAGYTMTVEDRGNSFLITNTFDGPPIRPPQTGDTANILLYIVLMTISGSMLIILGITGKRKRL